MSLRRFISEEGYRDNSPDKDNPFNIIPSSYISMKGVSHPVIGVDNLGNSQIMMPGGEYEFGGDYVTEFPMAQVGLQVDSLNNYMREKKSWEKIKGPDDPSYDELLNKDLTWRADGKETGKDVGYVGLYDTMIMDGPDAIPVSVPVHKKPSEEQYILDDVPAAAMDPNYPSHLRSNKKGPHGGWLWFKGEEHVQPRGLQVDKGMPTIDDTPREGIPELPEPTIINYTQKWNPTLKKWEQEPVYQVIAEPGQYKEGGIYIKPSKRGTFTAAAKKRGMGVQEFASKVMANKEDYSPAMVKKANFAKNAAGWKKGQFGGEYQDVELSDQEIADLRAQGYIVEEL